MLSSFHPDFDPFSEDSLNAIEMVEFLPDSIAFEHVMYDYRLERIVSYEFAHNAGEEEDLSPIVIDPSLMVSQFPSALKDSFPDVEYSISNLQIIQAEDARTNSMNVSFFANGKPHQITVSNANAVYETVDEHLNPVKYHHQADTITGLLASFLYARQYDPSLKTQAPMGLVPSTIITPRDSRLDLTERLIMSFGNLSGQSTTYTKSLFDNPADTPVVAVLINKEFPSRSATSNTLTLNELDNVNDIPTSNETILFQNVVTLDHHTPFIKNGKHANRYAEHRSSTLSESLEPTSERIYPDTHHDRWAHTCAKFLKLIETPMSVYAEFDEIEKLSDD